MRKITIATALLCFCVGIVSAVAVRLHKNAHDDSNHGDHSSHAAAAPEHEFNIQQQPLKAINGDVTTIAESSNDYHLINFWASWCVPCVREMPLLDKAQAQYNIPTVGITIDDIEVIKTFRSEHAISYPLYQSAFDIFYFMQQQGNRTAVLPYTVLIDGNGQVLREKVGDFKTIAEIAEFADYNTL